MNFGLIVALIIKPIIFKYSQPLKHMHYQAEIGNEKVIT